MNKSSARKLAIAVSASLAVTARTVGTHNSARQAGKRGVVTIPMAIVGDPGNPSALAGHRRGHV
jgi:hypothetical protein